MKEYKITKIVGVVAGILIMFVAIGFGIMYLIGTGLSKALNSGYDQSSSDNSGLTIIIVLLLFGLIMGIMPFLLKNKAWRMIYISLCLIVGIGFTITFIMSIGALGSINEIFILCLGVVFFLQSYFAIKKK
ncbi:hypothetical protein [Lederbergia citri]|uniref:Uncharacterized protein n=1 Tax=Lederbergia citri TaxID=2833580 RepID=A0A942TGP0_9BACI|nr:hypothetical protein [Lederbergia citri]MBS4197305.1 hypothetical protein [Lederbergia citri]